MTMSTLAEIPLSLFASAHQATPQQTVPLGTVLAAMQRGDWRHLVTRLRTTRTTEGEAAYRQAKTALPAVTFAGTFAPTRAKRHLVQQSGLIHGDLDHLPDVATVQAQLSADPTVVYAFVSPSGDGIKVGVRVAPVPDDATYKHAWGVVAAAHAARYGVAWDPSGKDISRLCFVAWDPDCVVRLDAEAHPIPPLPREPPSPWGMATPAPQAPASRRDAQRALDRAARLIRESVPGQQHYARCRAAYLLGGYIGGGLVSYEEARTTLADAVEATAEDIPRAMRTIDDGLRDGQETPITTATIATARQGWGQQSARPRPSVWTSPAPSGGTPWH